MRKLISFLLLTLLTFTCSRTKEEWKTRSIYRIVTDRFARTEETTEKCELSTYCGGTFQGIIDKLDYIQGMGFNAIWISPIVKNSEGSYHGYHTLNFYKVNEHFGTEEDLHHLVEECHKRDIWVMVDVVANHVARVGPDYSKIVPFNKSEYYHEECEITDWNDQWMVEKCRFFGLPDLNTEHPYVNKTLNDWIYGLVKTFNFDGIRIDTVPHVPKWFWDHFRKAAGVFSIGEIFNGNPDYAADYQNHLDSVINYPMYYTIKDSFCGDMRNIYYYLEYAAKKYVDTTVLGTFVENHDNPRFLNVCEDVNKFKNAIVFSIMWEGIPIVYYGGEQLYHGGADPQNREPLWPNYNKSEMYNMIAKANKARQGNELWKYEIEIKKNDEIFVAFKRGNALVMLTRGEACKRVVTNLEYEDGTILCNIFDEKDCVVVNDNTVNVIMGVEPKIYVLQ